MKRSMVEAWWLAVSFGTVAASAQSPEVLPIGHVVLAFCGWFVVSCIGAAVYSGIGSDVSLTERMAVGFGSTSVTVALLALISVPNTAFGAIAATVGIGTRYLLASQKDL